MCLQVHWKLVNLLHFLGNENVYIWLFEDLKFSPQPIQLLKWSSHPTNIIYLVYQKGKLQPLNLTYSTINFATGKTLPSQVTIQLIPAISTSLGKVHINP